MVQTRAQAKNMQDIASLIVTQQHEIEKVKMIPDGSGEFTRDMDMIVFKPEQNFGLRSWRYAMIVNDMEIEKMIVEPGKNQQGLDDDPYDLFNQWFSLAKKKEINDPNAMSLSTVGKNLRPSTRMVLMKNLIGITLK